MTQMFITAKSNLKFKYGNYKKNKKIKNDNCRSIFQTDQYLSVL